MTRSWLVAQRDQAKVVAPAQRPRFQNWYSNSCRGSILRRETRPGNSPGLYTTDTVPYQVPFVKTDFADFLFFKQKELRDLGRGVLTNPEARVTRRRCVSEPRRPSPECMRQPAGSAAGNARVDGSLPRRSRRSFRSHSLKSLPSTRPAGLDARLLPGL